MRWTVIRPEPEALEPLPSPLKLDLRATYGKRGLQVIVKMTNIELTPDKPNYDGDSFGLLRVTWHKTFIFPFPGNPYLIYF